MARLITQTQFDEETFGALLYEYRTARRISQTRAAEQCNLARAYWSELENLKTCPPPGKTVERISIGLSLSGEQKEKLHTAAARDRASSLLRIPPDCDAKVAKLIRALVQYRPALNDDTLRRIEMLLKMEGPPM